jgi:hypothetical protein
LCSPVFSTFIVLWWFTFLVLRCRSAVDSSDWGDSEWALEPGAEVIPENFHHDPVLLHTCLPPPPLVVEVSAQQGGSRDPHQRLDQEGVLAMDFPQSPPRVRCVGVVFHLAFDCLEFG